MHLLGFFSAHPSHPFPPSPSESFTSKNRRWPSMPSPSRPVGDFPHRLQFPIYFLLVVEPTPLKNLRQNGFIFPKFRGENKKYLSCHQLDLVHQGSSLVNPDTWRRICKVPNIFRELEDEGLLEVINLQDHPRTDVSGDRITHIYKPWSLAIWKRCLTTDP